jgi:uncharacterized protein
MSRPKASTLASSAGPSNPFRRLISGVGTYWVAKLDGKPAAGIMAMPQDMPPDVPPHWFEYLEVDDVDVRLKLVVELGGKLMRPPMPSPARSGR